MLTATALIVALNLAAESKAEPAPAETASGGAPTLEIDDEYGATTVGVLFGGRLEWTNALPRERILALKLSIDSYHREQPFAFRVIAEASRNDLLAEVGGKFLAPALGPFRGYAALCLGGAIRSGVGLASGSATVGIEGHIGARGLLTVEVEARGEGAASDEADAPEETPRSGHLGVLAGFAVSF